MQQLATILPTAEDELLYCCYVLSYGVLDRYCYVTSIMTRGVDCFSAVNANATAPLLLLLQ